jgi:hypothetical protein
LRLAVAYAIADGLPVIRLAHVQAALAVWSYSLASADYLFGDLCEDKTQAGILDLLRPAYPGGLTIAEINRSLSNHLRGGAMGDALDALQAASLIRAEIEASGGRPARRFYAVPPCDKSDKSDKRGVISHISLLSQPKSEIKGQDHPPPPPNPPPFRPGVGAESAHNGSTRAAHPPEPEAVEEIDY